MSTGIITKPAKRPPPRERVELILAQLDRLPTLPSVAVRLLAVTTSDESSARDVVEIIEADPTLTALIVKMACRADQGVRSETVTVARAVSVLGFDNVRNAVLSFQLYDALSRSKDSAGAAEARQGLWRHSLALACTASMIGERVGGSTLGSEAFGCGLLHDIGKIALDASLPKSYARVVERVERFRTCISDAEREIFGMDHTAAGKRLATRWRLPAPVIECIWLHHQGVEALPSSVVHGRLVRIVYLADNLVRREDIGFSGYQYVCDVNGAAAELKLDERELDRIMARVPETIGPLCELIGLEDSDDRADYSATLTSANRQLALRNEKLTELNRRLQIRSACFAALEQFTKRLAESDGIGDVCVAVADSLRGLLSADCVVAFFGDMAGRCVYTGRAELPDHGQAASVVELDANTESVGSKLSNVVPVARTLAPAGEALGDIWELCTGDRPREPLWVLPLVTNDAAVAAVLVAAEESVIHRIRAAVAEVETLSMAMGVALTSARARAESERMTDEVLDLNRRIQATRKRFVRDRSISMIGAMASGAAHEMNNPLSVISGRAQMEVARCTDPDTARALQIIIDQSARATQIVTDLMEFAKPRSPQPNTQLLSDVLQPLLQHWCASSSLTDRQLTVHLADPDVTVYADEEQLREVVDALIANALESTTPETARVQINSPSRASDETVRIVVEDNGVGMTRDVLEHAVDPFFSNRPAGRGRGLGLSRAYRYAEINGGKLWLESTPNVGTIATVELPARGSNA